MLSVISQPMTMFTLLRSFTTSYRLEKWRHNGSWVKGSLVSSKNCVDNTHMAGTLGMARSSKGDT